MAQAYGVLVNISNHPSTNWSEKQKEGWKEIVDIPFPKIDPRASEEEIIQMVGDLHKKLLKEGYRNIMIQGEFSFVSAFLLRNSACENSHFKFWVPTTDRKVTEIKNPDGTVTKKSEFRFVQWRRIDPFEV